MDSMSRTTPPFSRRRVADWVTSSLMCVCWVGVVMKGSEKMFLGTTYEFSEVC